MKVNVFASFILFALTLCFFSVASAAKDTAYVVEGQLDVGVKVEVVSVGESDKKRFGVVSEGKIIVPIVYKAIEALSDGFILQDNNDMFSVVDAKGSVTIPPEYFHIKRMDRIAILECKKECTDTILMNSKGEVLGSGYSSYAWGTNQAVVCEHKENGYSAFHPDGKNIGLNNMPLLEWDAYSKSLYAPQMVNDEMKVAFYDIDGKVIVPNSYDFAQYIDQMEFFIVHKVKNGTMYYGAIDRTGKVVIADKYTGVKRVAYNTFEFTNGAHTVVAVMKDGALKVTEKM